jgi:hypothetical protein
LAEDREDLVADLMALLGEDGYFRLCDKLGGVRLAVPRDPARSELPAQVGAEIAGHLSKAYPGGYIRVPIARTLRARRYRDAGMSNRDIALRLGMTENAVMKLFIRERRAGRELISKRAPQQLDLFS